MTYLLDTNVVSELRNRAKADSRVIAWESSVDSSSVFLSVISVLELETGTQSMERRDARQGTELRRWLDTRVLPSFESRILPIDLQTALRCAGLHVPNRRSYRDALIAATALVHGMTVVTRNVADFAPTGVRVLNPWEP
ncbi:MAG: type II toxin-antitoxin system VapC family toxin [Terracidiphilus sp.]